MGNRVTMAALAIAILVGIAQGKHPETGQLDDRTFRIRLREDGQPAIEARLEFKAGALDFQSPRLHKDGSKAVPYQSTHGTDTVRFTAVEQTKKGAVFSWKGVISVENGLIGGTLELTEPGTTTITYQFRGITIVPAVPYDPVPNF